MRKLLIIGNGFDLYCGLESTYHHFFQYLRNDLDYQKAYNYLFDKQKKQSNFRTNLVWALLLAYHNEENTFLWKDIESILSSFLYRSTKDYGINLDDLIANFQIYVGEFRTFDQPRIYESSQMNKFLFLVYRGVGLTDLCEIKQQISSVIFIPKSKTDIVNRFYDDLISFEDKFVKYLQSIYDNHRNIHMNANDLFARLLDVKYSDETDFLVDLSNAIEQTSILSFNYTRLGKPNGGYFLHYRNIHGTILGQYKKIIFGIDSHEINPNDIIYKFTKTYRVSLMESSLNTKPGAFSGQISLMGIKEIIIYGHSLNNQDSSYFYAIFNRCDIDKSNVSLCLYYSDYGNQDRAIENLLRLQNLIFDYQNLFDLPKGLFQRMLLEGRISVVKI